jgi:predicted transposase/invertase (TIGR01784 family)
MNENKLFQIHDKLFKETFSHVDNVRDFLLRVIPPEELVLLDLNSITFNNTSYISSDLRESLSDVVVSCKLKNIDYTLELCFLLEHKSYKDEHAILQIDEYLIKAYQTQYKNNKELKLIVPLLYYHGEDDWQMKDLKEFFPRYPQEFHKYIPTHESIFVSLKDMTEEQIFNFQNNMLISTILVQKNRNDADKMAESLQKIINFFDPYTHGNFIKSILVYSTVTAIRKEEILRSITKLPPKIKEDMVTLAEQWINEGIERGIEQGIERGIEQGIERGIEQGESNKLEMLVCNMALKRKLKVKEIAEIAEITEEEVRVIISNNGLSIQ